MSADENKVVVKRFYDELWNQRRVEIADEIFATDCITHQLQSGAEDVGVLRNAEAIRHHVNGWPGGISRSALRCRTNLCGGRSRRKSLCDAGHTHRRLVWSWSDW